MRGFSLRTGGKLLSAMLCLAAAGCAALPERWSRSDKRQIDPKEIVTDRAICEEEIKANLTASNQRTIWGPTDDAIIIYTGCMARRGYAAK
jgi:hypothetical protein